MWIHLSEYNNYIPISGDEMSFKVTWNQSDKLVNMVILKIKLGLYVMYIHLK